MWEQAADVRRNRVTVALARRHRRRPGDALVRCRGDAGPKLLGILMQLAGVCYLTNSFALILLPTLASRLFPFVLLPPFVAELSMALWLLLKGVNMTKWAERADVTA